MRNGNHTQYCLDTLTCLPFLSCQPTQLLPSRLYLILYRWANSLPMPSAWRPWVPTSVMKCSERRSTWRYSLRASGSDMMSGHQAPSPSPLSKSSLEERRTQLREETGGRVQRRRGAWQWRGRERKGRQMKRGNTVNVARYEQRKLVSWSTMHDLYCNNEFFGYLCSTLFYQHVTFTYAGRWRAATNRTLW